MRETVAERKRLAAGANGEMLLLDAVAKMKEPARGMATRIHKIVKANAPELMAKTWYGMPAWAKGDKVVLFFQDAAKFKYRYSTLGFQDAAAIDDGNMWPTAYALTDIGPAEEAKIVALVKKAVR